MFELLFAILIEKILETLIGKLVDWLQNDRTLRLHLQRHLLAIYLAILTWLGRRK